MVFVAVLAAIGFASQCEGAIGSGLQPPATGSHQKYG
jgi:hypothetical protein